VEAFNSAACTNPDPLLLEDFLADYEDSRMFGLSLTIAMRTVFILSNVTLPSSGEQVSEEMFDAMKEQQNETYDIASRMKVDPKMKDVLMELAEEVVQVMDDLKIV
jgi:hypothetical protein